MADLARLLQPFATYGEFIAWETAQEGRYEYDGQVYAMSGASPRHNALESNLNAALKAEVGKGPCSVWPAGQRISASGGSQYVYADASMVCEPIALTHDTHAILNASLIVEVISDSSEGRDRGTKWLGYRKLPTLLDYLLVSQYETMIEQFSRDKDAWIYTIHGAGDVLTLADGLHLPVDEVYDDVWRFPSDRDL